MHPPAVDAASNVQASRPACSSGRHQASSGSELTQAQRPTRRQLIALLWRHSAAAALAAPLTLSFAHPAAALSLLNLQPGGPAPPGGGGGSSGGGGGGGGGGSGSSLRLPQEVAQLADASRPVVLTLASFAVTRKPYRNITRRFIKQYQEDTGRTVRFRLTFNGSGTQARAIIDGLPADIAALALPLDIQKISDAGLIEPNWAERVPNRASVCESVVSIVTRRGNPKGITGWDDLERDDIEIVVANPKTAGVARWIFLALWGHRLNQGEAAARRFVTRCFDNVEVMPRDAREASDVFYSQGFGDVLLTYENEAVFTNLVVAPNAPLPFLSPDNNVRITCPAAVIDRNVSAVPEVREAAEAFVAFLHRPEAQREFVACGFRTPDREMAAETDLPHVRDVWEVERRLGDWISVQKKFFDDAGILSVIMLDVSQRKLQERLAARRR